MTDHFNAGVSLVTGAGSGIGRATSLSFASEGCQKIALGDCNLEGLEKTRDLINQRFPSVVVFTYTLDVSKEDQVESFHAAVIEKFGRIDFTANVAGYGHPTVSSVDLEDSEIDKSLGINLTGVFLCERAQLRQMLTQEPLPGYQCRGSIVNVASLCAKIAIEGLTAYSATKAAALGISKGDALDYGPNGIRINCVGPGNTLTPMLQNVMGPEHIEKVTAMTPLRRLAQPEDIANAISWLSSPKASFITGIFLPVDGGFALNAGPF